MTDRRMDRVRFPRPARTLAALALGLSAALLAGCKSDDGLTTGGLPDDGYRTKYPIVVAEGPETLDIPVGYGSAGLGDTTRAKVRAFAADAAERATSTLVILAPSGAANDAAAGAIARQARSEALAAGLSKSVVEMRPYAVADRSAAAPVRLTYNRIKAQSPRCGRWEGEIIERHTNGDGVEFGCATQANLAAMIADPEDLVSPRAATPAAGARRVWVLGQWVTGETTSTSEELDTTGTTEE